MRARAMDHSGAAPKTIAGLHGSDQIEIPTQRTFTPEGYLRVPAKIARTGIYLYRARELGIKGVDGDRVLRVFRPDDEVFHPDAMASFHDKPVTNGHPPEDVTAKKWREMASKGLVVGDISDIGRDDGAGPGGIHYLTGSLLVRDEGAIKDIESGKSQVSNGYTFDADMTPGEWNGQRYDLVQRRIRGNHVAVVDAGRAGPGCRIADEDNDHNRSQRMETVTISINGISIRVPAADAQAATDAKMSIEKAIKDCMDGLKSAKDAHDSIKTAHDKMSKSMGVLQERFGKKDDDEDDSEKKGKDSASLDIVDLYDLKVAGIRKHYRKAADAKETELAAAKAKAVTDEQVADLVIARSVAIDGAIKLVGKEFSAGRKTTEVIQREAVAHVIAKDEALKPVAEGFLCGVALDKAPADKVASVFGGLVAVKASAPASRANDGAGARAGTSTGSEDQTSVFKILAHDTAERRSQDAGNGGGEEAKVIDLRDPIALLRDHEQNGGRGSSEEAGA